VEVIEGAPPHQPRATFVNQTHVARTLNATWARTDGGTPDLSALAREVTLVTLCAFARGESASMMTSVPITWLALTISVKTPALGQTAHAGAMLSARFQTTVQCVLVPMATKETPSPNAFAHDEVEFGSFESGKCNEIYYDKKHIRSLENIRRARTCFRWTFRYLLKTIALPKTTCNRETSVWFHQPFNSFTRKIVLCRHHQLD